jgi:hypothetical protein
MRQELEVCEQVQIRQLCYPILREHESGDVRYRFVDLWMYTSDSVAREQKRPQPRAQREVCEGGNVIVGEINAVVILQSRQSFLRSRDRTPPRLQFSSKE